MIKKRLITFLKLWLSLTMGSFSLLIFTLLIFPLAVIYTFTHILTLDKVANFALNAVIKLFKLFEWSMNYGNT